MEMITWITMALVMAFIWGGFGLLLSKALREESRKRGAS